MRELLTAFTLGNSAILTNACMLPLYPGLIAFMAANTDQRRRVAALLGAAVLAGVLSMMLLIALVLYAVRASFGDLLPYLLPVVYIIVIGMGALMLFGRNPFARMATLRSPAARNPLARAYLYGLLLAPMTLPCTGPVVTSVFILGTNTGAFLDGLMYFFAFGLGFGWPLVLLPLLASSLQRQLVGWLTRHHRRLEQASGLLLIGIGVFGFVVEYFPNIAANAGR
jgi:cytochrome c-type biogenesis protein